MHGPFKHHSLELKVAQGSSDSQSKKLLEDSLSKLDEIEKKLRSVIMLLDGASAQPTATDDSLRAEYAALANVLNSRHSTMMALNAIVMLAVVTVLSFALTNRLLGNDPIFNLGIDGWISFFAVVLVFVAWLNYISTRSLNDATKTRIGEIEDLLHIKHSISKPGTDEGWGGFYRKAGVFSWHVLYELLVVSAFLTTAQLWPTASNVVYTILVLEVIFAAAVIVRAWKNHKQTSTQKLPASQSASS